MSWIVEDYLINRYDIESNSSIGEDAFDNLLLIKKAIKDLNLSERDRKIIEYVSLGYSFREIGKLLNLYRVTVSLAFHKSCEKIAEYLGDYFTEEGFEKYMIETCHLTPAQIRSMRQIITSRFKHKLSKEKKWKEYYAVSTVTQ